MCADRSAPSFNLVTTLKQFETLKEDWTRLYDKHGQGIQLFQDYNWIFHWLKNFNGAETSLTIVTGVLNDELVMVIPLVLKRPAGLRVLEWAGSPVSQYGDILMKPEANNMHWITEGFKFISNKIKPDLYHLRKTRFDSTVFPLLENIEATVLEEMAAPYIEIRGAENFTEFNKRYSQRSRKSKRRHRRKLEEHGETDFAIHKNGPEAANIIAEALKQKRQWLKDNHIYSIAFQTDGIESFWNSVATDQSNPVNLRTSHLMVADQTAAIEVGLIAKNRYGAHIGSYNREFIQHSPGSLQMQDTIAALIKEGIETIDLFAPADTYKIEWTDLSTPVYDIAYPATLKGRAYSSLYLQCIRPALKLLAPTVLLIKNIFTSNKFKT